MAMMIARDIMTQDVITLDPDSTVREAAHLLLHYRIHGAPVIAPSGRLVGMVSMVDLVGRQGASVSEVMTRDPVCAPEETAAEELASTMLHEMVRRIPIVRDGEVVGIVSASDIVRLFLDLHERSAPQKPRLQRRTARAELSR